MGSSLTSTGRLTLLGLGGVGLRGLGLIGPRHQTLITAKIIIILF